VRKAAVTVALKGVPVEGVIGLFVVARMAGEQGTIAARRTYAASASVVLAPEHAFTLLLLAPTSKLSFFVFLFNNNGIIMMMKTHFERLRMENGGDTW
jgi:hypothetical protein